MSEILKKGTSTSKINSKLKSKVNLKPKKSMSALSDHGYSKSNVNILSLVDEDELLIYTIYDVKDSLVEIVFPYAKVVPKKLLKIILLIVSFHPYLNKITIKKGGVDKFVIHELKNLLSASFITELCLDDNIVREKNWCDLLVGFNQLKNLSLARCSIDDSALNLIMKKLTYDQPAGQTLMMLNLTTNFITDKGAKSISVALRANRTLRYLNLSDNQITDVGAGYILETLTKFLLTSEEIFWKRRRRLDYALLFASYYEKCLAKVTEDGNRNPEDITSKTSVKKLKGKQSVAGSKAQKKRDSAYAMMSAKKNGNVNAATNTFDQDSTNLATSMALDLLGPDPEPFGYDDTECQSGNLSCLGNMTLTYLNLAYNKIEFPTIWAILNVFFYHAHRRRPNQLGLMKVIIEGNLLPNICDEFAALEEMMEKSINEQVRSKSTMGTLKKDKAKKNTLD